MSKKKRVSQEDLKRLTDLIEDQPDLYERILDIAQMTQIDKDGHIPTFDELESALIPKIRKLGQETMTRCTESVEAASSAQLRGQQKVTLREKKRSR